MERFRSAKLVSIAALIAAGALGLTACGSDSNNSGSGDSSTPATSQTSDSGSTNSGSGNCGSGGTLNADGSTAQQNAVNGWIQAFKTQCPGLTVNYGGVGSGQGITDFTGGKVAFAGSDAALDPSTEVAPATKECGSPAIDLPMVTGPIAVAYNVSGVSKLILTPTVMAKIFDGKIKTWNDPAIKAINPGVNLPSANITVFFRSDESGTTQNFETYLNTVDKADFNHTPSKDWAGAGQGKSGSQGVQAAIKSTQNSIGYIEWSYAGSGGLNMAEVDSGSGPVALTAESAGLAVQAAQEAPNSSPGDLSLKLDYTTKAKGAYPIILVTYEIVCTKYKDASVGANVKAFLTYTSSAAGQELLTKYGSAPLPQAVLSKVQAEVAKIS